MSNSSTRELEWFDLETRMRELLYLQLEPVIQKAKEDREKNSSLKIYCKSLEKRVKDLEIVVLGDKTGETAIIELINRCAEIDGNAKKQVVRLDQEISQINESMKKTEFLLETANESMKILADTKDHTEADISSLKVLIEENKHIVLAEVEKLNLCFQEMNKVYMNLAYKSEEKALEAIHKANQNSMEMMNYKKEVDGIRKDIVESLSLIKEVRGFKLDSSIFETRIEIVDKKFIEINHELQRQRDNLLNRDAFIDKFIPLQTATMISDYLHYFTDLKTKKKIAEYENIKLKELNYLALDVKEVNSREDQMGLILDEMKHIEERKVELLTNEPVGNGKISKRVTKVGDIQFPPNFEESPRGPPGLSKDEVEEIVYRILSIRLESDFLKFRLEMQNNIEKIYKNITNLSNESQSMDHQILLEIQDLGKRLEKTQKTLMSENSELVKVYDILKSELKINSHSLNSLGQMLVCLVENAQIEQALEAQDEEDRHNMAYNFEKELQSELVMQQPKDPYYTSTIPSANFAFQKKCVSCGTANSILSGFRTSLLYKPTPLFYRSKKFDRPELIGLKGRILKACWDSTSLNLPWKHEAFEKIISEAAKTDISTSINEQELPRLVTPNYRARSTHNRKFRYGSVSG